MLGSLRDFIFGSPEDQVIMPDGLTFFQLMEVGLRELGESHPIEGCTPDDISKLEEHYSLKLPKSYRVFMSAVGRHGGPFLRGSDYFFPGLLHMRDWASELLAENKADWTLQPTDFVFFMHQGYQFAFFSTDHGDDPAVWYYHESHGQPTMSAVSFSHWVVRAMAYANDGPPQWFIDRQSRNPNTAQQ